MKTLSLILSLLCLPAFAEPRTVTLVTKANSGERRLEIPAYQSAEIVSSGPTPYANLQIHKDGTVLVPPPPPTRFVFAGPVTVLMLEHGVDGYSPWVTVQLTPETFDANKALVLGPTTNTVIVSYQSSSNLVDWTTVTNQVFQGVPSAQFFRVTASPTVTP